MLSFIWIFVVCGSISTGEMVLVWGKSNCWPGWVSRDLPGRGKHPLSEQMAVETGGVGKLAAC